jgi:hypothetical protein
LLAFISLAQTVGLKSLHEPEDAEAEVESMHDAIIQVNVDISRE